MAQDNGPIKAKLTKRTVDAQKPTGREYSIWDADIKGFGLRVHPSGRKTYFMKYRTRDAKRTQVKLKIGVHGDVTPDGARKIAERWRDEIAAGGNPSARLRAKAEKEADSFRAVMDTYLDRHIYRKGKKRNGAITEDDAPRRSAKETRRIFDVYVLPEWENRDFRSVRRDDVTALLDKVEDNHGPVQADRVLAAVRGLFVWYQARKADYVAPTVPGMARTKPSARRRSRTLNDGEIRLLWQCAEGSYGAMLKVLLLTGQRRDKAVTMRWRDIKDGVWTLPREPREKVNPGSLKLPRMVLDIIEAQPKIDKCPCVFPGRGNVPMQGFSKLKKRLDKVMAEGNGQPIPPWVVHDLRRTAKTLMQRAGVDSFISERVLGHAIAGIEGTYGMHKYDREKADALAVLSRLVAHILDDGACKAVSRYLDAEDADEAARADEERRRHAAFRNALWGGNEDWETWVGAVCNPATDNVIPLAAGE